MDTARTLEIASIANRLKTEFATDQRPLTPQMETLLEQLRQAERNALPANEGE